MGFWLFFWSWKYWFYNKVNLTGEADWVGKLQRNYGLKKGLVDVNGEPVEHDFDD